MSMSFQTAENQMKAFEIIIDKAANSDSIS